MSEHIFVCIGYYLLISIYLSQKTIIGLNAVRRYWLHILYLYDDDDVAVILFYMHVGRKLYKSA